MRAAVVLGPHARGQRERDAVGPADRLVLVAERLHGDDRAEDLVLDQLVVLAQAVDDRRLVEVPAVALALPARDDGRVVRRALDEPADVGELVGVVERAVEHVAVVRRPGLRVARLLRERGDEVVVDARAGQHAGRGRAVLARR